jgi:AmiR/NasT family two-component response regulator
MLSGERILVAEDECMIALDLTDTLERAGASVIGPAATVQEVLRVRPRSHTERAMRRMRIMTEAA